MQDCGKGPTVQCERLWAIHRSSTVLAVAMFRMALRNSVTVLLRMSLAQMAIKDERLSVQIMMCLLVALSRKLQASRIGVSSVWYTEQ